MTFTLLSPRLRIKNTWITDSLSEILSTYILAIFVIGSGAQYVLSRGVASSIAARNLAAGMGLCFAVYMGGNASGSCVNPTIGFAFCVLGKVKWRKYPLFVASELIGAFLAAACVYALNTEALNNYDGGTRQVSGANATATIFASFPNDGISNLAAFFEVVAANALLVGLSVAMVDPRNTAPHLGVVPLPLGFLVFAIASSFSYNSGAPINPAIDFASRCFAASVGYGSAMFSRNDYYFWIPVVGDMIGGALAVTLYQFAIGLHLKPTRTPEHSGESSVDSVKIEGRETIPLHVSDVKPNLPEKRSLAGSPVHSSESVTKRT